MGKYRISKAAKDDLIRIHQDGTKRFGPQQDDRYFEALFEHFHLIAERPYSFEAVDYIKTGYRRCVCSSDSIYYKIDSDVVDIMAIIGKQDVGSFL